MKKKFLLLLIFLLVVISVLNVNTTPVSGVEHPNIYVDPATTLDITLTPGSSYTISIKTDYTGDDIYGYQFYLRWNPNVLRGVEATNGDIVTKAKHASATFIEGYFDNDAGELLGTIGLFLYTAPDPAPVTSGPGILANVTFRVLKTGASDITIGPESRLKGFTDGGYGLSYNIVDAETMPDHIRHGFFSNRYAIYIDPATTLDTTIMPGENYTTSIKTNYNGTDVWGYEFTLTYDPNVLRGVNVTNGDLITKAKNESAQFIPGTFYNNTLGKLSLTGAAFLNLTLPVPVTSGPGILANVTFTVMDRGTSDITLGSETRLIGANAATGQIYNITNRVYHGYFDNTFHDIAVTNVTASPNTVDLGDSVGINVTVRDGGNYNETFNVTVYADIDTTDIGDEITMHAYNEDTWTGDNVTKTFNTTIQNIVPDSEEIYVNQTIMIRATERMDTWTGDNMTKVFLTTRKPVFPDSEEIYVNQTIMIRATERMDTWTGDNMTKVFLTTRKPVFPDSEEIYVNQTIMTRDVDYTIDYTTGNITFTIAPEQDVEVKATYQYGHYTIDYTTGNITFTIAPEQDVEVKATYQYGHYTIDYTTGNITFTIAPEQDVEVKATYEYYGVHMRAGNSTILNFNWNTTAARSGSYTITASASLVLSETNTTNNVGETMVIISGPPVASFTYLPDKPIVNEIVTFNASASYDPDPGGDVVSYQWDFGDGNVTSGDNEVITHVYTAAGNYTVNLTVTDINSETDTTAKNITIGKLSSTITISASPETITLDSTATISGFITPTRAGATVTVWYRRSGQSWSTTNVTTNEESQYSHTWTPETDGNYTFKASWSGDGNTHSAESPTTTVEVIKVHDIAVTSVVASSTTVKIGETVTINVTVTNQGHYTELFNLTVYANTTIIGTPLEIQVTSGSSNIIPVTWDTSGIAKGDYTISATATPVSGETDTDDNTYIDGVVTVEEAPPLDISIYAVGAGVAIIVIAGIGVYMLKIRKPKST